MRTALVSTLLAITSCATLPESPGGGEGLPSAGAGPFRALVAGEIGNSRSAPNALTDSRGFGRDIAVIDLDGDPSTYDVAGFVAAAVKEGGQNPTRDSPTKAIVRYGALDGRSFDRSADVVIEAGDGWEGGVIGAPAALRVDGAIWIYYAAAGGIGLARGDALGTTFSKESEPVLTAAGSGWAAGAVPQSPGVVRLADGTFRLFFEVPLPGGGTAIGEARSTGGLQFEPIGDGPVLAPDTTPSAGDDPVYDGAAVGGPFPMLAGAENGHDGEPILRVYYGATDSDGKKTIGLAARYGGEGPLSRAVAPVFGTGKPLDPGEPCVVVFDGFSLLFATQRSSTTGKDPAVAAGLAPATAALPPPDPK